MTVTCLSFPFFGKHSTNTKTLSIVDVMMNRSDDLCSPHKREFHLMWSKIYLIRCARKNLQKFCINYNRTDANANLYLKLAKQSIDDSCLTTSCYGNYRSATRLLYSNNDLGTMSTTWSIKLFVFLNRINSLSFFTEFEKGSEWFQEYHLQFLGQNFTWSAY